MSFSVPSGERINRARDQQCLSDALLKEAISDSLLTFTSEGPDIVAISKSEFWQVECQGVGAGKQSTQRNNFDRALASAVSYFTDRSPEFLGELSVLNKATPTLGLALPASSDYISNLRKRVRAPLRRSLNLWILIYDPRTGQILPIAPVRTILRIRGILGV